MSSQSATVRPVSTSAVVAFRGRRGGKGRLAGALDADERGALAVAMLADVLAALSASPDVDRTFVVTEDGAAAIEPAPMGVTWVAEPQSGDSNDLAVGLNAALVHGRRLAEDAGAGRVLIVHADLPLLSPSDVAALLEADPPTARGGVVVGPDRAFVGTNALLLRPPDVLEPRFGPESFQAHLADAARVGAPAAVVRRQGISLDVDTPDDLLAYLRSDPRGATKTALEGLGARERLGRSGAANCGAVGR